MAKINNNRLATYAWGVITYNIFVILWGAFVRATGSGAGCGSHWPLCDGVVIPRAEQIETIIEFTHRLTSSFAGVLVLGLLFWSYRHYPKGHRVRRGANWSLFFILVEGGIGAGLVRFELVAGNVSVTRAFVAAAHLGNTFLLLAALTLTAWWAGGGMPFQKQSRQINWLLAFGFVGMLILGGSGAITALGDTLFPSETLLSGLQQDFAATANFLIRLRVWHPVLAVGLGIYLLWASTIITAAKPQAQKYSQALKYIFLIQLGVGVVNVFLLAPIWMQLIHLLLADLVWIVMVLLTAVTLTHTATVHTATVHTATVQATTTQPVQPSATQPTGD